VSDYSLVQAGFGAPARQNRWKVAFRLLLAIPLELWLVVLTIAAVVLIVIGWFAALFLGRLPSGIARFLSNYLIFITRVYSYIYLMNDAYPPFSADADFGVNLEIPVSKVRRLAVLFRYLLMIPALIVLMPLTIGLQICAVFIWLIVLVKGEMPLPVFGAVAATLRFEARVSAYAMMLTGKYPGELFGEKSATGEPLDSPHSAIEPAAEDRTGISAPWALPVNAGGVRYASAPAAPSGAPVVFATAGASTPSEPPRTARLVLRQSSKRILVTFLILGTLGYAAAAVIDANAANDETALTRLTTANALVNTGVTAAKATLSSCALGQNACNHQYFVSIANVFGAFQVTLDGTSFPSSSTADAARFEYETNSFVSLLDQLKSGGTITQAQVNQLNKLGSGWDTDFNQVISDLSSPI
jgi:hypothetical protein